MNEGSLAPDVVCISGDTINELFSTEFHINFDRKQINLFGIEINQESNDEELEIVISCNSTPCPNVLAMLNQSKIVEFIESNGQKTIQPSSEVLKHFNLIRGRNLLIFESKILNMKVECSVYLWNYSDKIVVVDIDGTLTRSDVRGYVETVYLGRYDYVHDGAVAFFSNLQKEFNVYHLYLTSRPLHHLEDTKAFLRLVRDRKGNSLPIGPLFTNKENIMKAIYRELVAKTTAQFKGSVLVDILSLFILAGVEHTPYCLGVGNKETDALAYRMAGLNSSRILLVHTNSTIVVSVAATQTLGPPLSPTKTTTTTTTTTTQRRATSTNTETRHDDSFSAQRPESGRLSLSLFGSISSMNSFSLKRTQTDKNQIEKIEKDMESNETTTTTNQSDEFSRTNLTFTAYSDPTLWQYVRLKMHRNYPPKSTKKLLADIPTELYSPSLLKSISEEESNGSNSDISDISTPSMILTSSTSTSSSTTSSTISGSNLPPQLRLSRAKSAGSYHYDQFNETPSKPLPPVDFHQTETIESLTSPMKSSSISSSSSVSSSSTPKTNRPSINSNQTLTGQNLSTRKKLKDMTDFFNPIESADI